MNSAKHRWILFGLCGWMAILSIAIADIGFQGMLAGRTLAESWRTAAWLGVLWTIPGAVLSLAVVAVFHYHIRDRSSTGARLPAYAAAGLGYWIGWATIFAVFVHTGATGAVALGQGDDSFANVLVGSMAGLAFNALLLFGAMAVIHEASLYMRQARMQERRRTSLEAGLARARRSALSARLDPHFLFNTLHVASGLMGRSVSASRAVLDDLRELLAEAIGRQDRSLVRLEEEVRLVERYLRIQRARFGERLEVEIEVDPTVRSVLVPPLLLQPLVENAIQHGIARSRSGGRVRIVAHRSLRRVHLVVEDTGESVVAAEAAVSERVGLGGVRARLGLIFGESATARFSGLPSGGFRACVAFPALSFDRTERTPPQPPPAAGSTGRIRRALASPTCETGDGR